MTWQLQSPGEREGVGGRGGGVRGSWKFSSDLGL